MSDQQITFPKKYKYLSPRYIPNYLTILRMVLVPIIIILLLNNNHKVVYQYKFFDETYTFYSNYFIAGILFIIACLTDYLDGYLARKNN
jgi:CDP-diacylglycerol--glycerol-3-phosphate 3-phosphatidyltransferase